MIIEKLEPMIRQEHTFRVLLSDGSVIKTQDYVIADLGLYPGMELDEDALSALKAAAAKASAKQRAVKIISAAGVSKEELRRRLTQKGETAEDAEEAVQWLSELQLLDDAKTAEQIVRSAIHKGYGEARIKQILFEKRIPKEYWQQALQEIPAMDDAIDQFLRQRLRGCQPDQKEIKRMTDALLRRGHSWQDIRAGLKRYNEALELEWEEPYD